MTGVDPSFHGIFDFFTRDPDTYLPILSSAEIKSSRNNLRLGNYSIPLGKPRIRMLRKSKSFWSILGEHGVFGSIIRVPITFPPEKFNGLLLSGMCVPDLQGSQGTFSFYTSDVGYSAGSTGGNSYRVALDGDTVHANLDGPENPFIFGKWIMKVSFTLVVDSKNSSAQLKIGGNTFDLEQGNYSPWIKVMFGLCLDKGQRYLRFF